MIRLVLFSFLFVLNVACYAQNFADQEYYLIDSLDLTTVTKNDSLVIEKALKNYHKAIDDTSRIQALEFLVEECLNNDVWPHYNWLVYRKVTIFLKTKQSEKERKALNVSLGSALNNIGFHAEAIGEIPKALEYYHKALKVQEECSDKKGLATSFNNLGYVYNYLGDRDRAIKYYKLALKLRREIGDQKRIANSLNNIGYFYKSSKDYDNALLYYNKALAIRELIEDEFGIANSLNNIGVIYFTLEKNDFARKYYIRSLEIRDSIGHKSGIAESLNNLGALEFKEGNLLKAEIYSLRSLKIARNVGSPAAIKYAADLLRSISEKRNKPKRALEMYKLYIEMRDSLNNKANLVASAQQQAKYEYEKQKELDDAENSKLIALKEKEKETQFLYTSFFLIALIIVGVLLIVIVKKLKVAKERKLVIEKQKIEVEEQKEVIEYTYRELASSINYAKRLQYAILPSMEEIKTFLPASFVFFQPRNVVSGDFYWFEKRADITFIAVADCTGHGVPGALVSVVCSNALNRSVKEFNITEPAKILDKTREMVIETFAKSGGHMKDGMDIVFCAFKDNKVIFSGANNPLWIVRKTSTLSTEIKENKDTILRADYSLIEYKGNKQPIGFHERMEAFTQEEIELYEGDILYLFTDGYADQFGGRNGKKFKYRPFKNFLIDISQNETEIQRTALFKQFDEWKGIYDQVDDVCVLGIKIDNQIIW